MMKTNILTITLNPAVDVFTTAPVIKPIHKIRATNAQYGPGGGGINVARIVNALGGQCAAIYLSGGATGQLFDALIEKTGIPTTKTPVTGETRLCYNVREAASELEYRFVPAGPTITESEIEAFFVAIAKFEPNYVVASGSLPPGAPEDLLVRVGKAARSGGARFVLDCSGPGMAAAVAAGGTYLIKPSLGELQQVVGKELEGEDVAQAAMELVRSGASEMVAVTLGLRGAVLATSKGALHIPACTVHTRSAVGAGDSFLGAMVFALADGWEVERAFRLGLAAGAATAATQGPDLGAADEILRLFKEIDQKITD